MVLSDMYVQVKSSNFAIGLKLGIMTLGILLDSTMYTRNNEHYCFLIEQY